MSTQSTPSSSATDELAPPSRVEWAFRLFLAAAAVSIVGFFLSLGQIGPQRSRLIAQGFSATKADSTIHLAIGLLIAGVVFGILLVGLMAVLFRGGARWARNVLIVIAALSLIGLFRDPTAGFGIDALHAVLLVVASVFSLLPESAAWLARIKEAVKGGRIR